MSPGPLDRAVRLARSAKAGTHGATRVQSDVEMTQEQEAIAMTWTRQRPTKPGKYWLSIGIDHREKFASDVCREPHHVYLLDIFEEGGGLWRWRG